MQFRTQGSIPSQYTGHAVIDHQQTLGGGGSRSVFGSGTYEYTNGTTLDWTNPRFQGANYNSSWGLQPNVTTTGSITVYGSNVADGALYGAPVDGLKIWGSDQSFVTGLSCP